MRTVLLVFHLMLTLIMITIILLQKGEDAGSGSVGGKFFSAQGAKSGLTTVTYVLGALFVLDCIGLAALVKRDARLALTPVAEIAPLPSKNSSAAVPSPAVPKP